MKFKTVKLANLLNVVGGFAFSALDFDNTGEVVVRISNIVDGVVDFSNVVRIPKERLGKGTDFRVKSGDILIAMSGATTGKIGVVPTDVDFEIYQNQRVGNFKIAACNKLDKKYLYYFLKSSAYQKQVWNSAAGVAQPNISSTLLESFEIPLPNLPDKESLVEQKRIAAILDKADALRQKRKQSLKLLDEFIRSVFLEMFGDPVVNPKRWPVYTVGQLLERKVLLVHKDGNFGSQYPRAHEFGDSGVPFLTAKAVSGAGSIIASEVSFLNEDKANTLPFGWIEDGDVLLAHNATVGRVGLYRGQFKRALIGTSLTCYRPNPDAIYSAFLFALLRSHLFQSQLSTSMAQTTRNQVPITVQRQMKLVLPPLKKQMQFDRVLKKVDKIREHNELALDSQEGLFNSLVQRAFRGEL